jgi:hypothetical protein
MGSHRSGRRLFIDAKTTVEACRSIDIVQWSREGLTRPGTNSCGTWEWRSSRTGGVQSSIDYRIDMTDPHVRLQYVITKTGERFDYCVDVVPTYPHYGGLRWWFLCPVTVASRACGRRVRKLFLRPGGSLFACRQCCRLSYTSQRTDAMNRALAKAQGIRERLGGNAAMLQPFPPRPKGMWRRTFNRLQWKSEQLWVASLRTGLRLPPD